MCCEGEHLWMTLKSWSCTAMQTDSIQCILKLCKDYSWSWSGFENNSISDSNIECLRACVLLTSLLTTDDSLSFISVWRWALHAFQICQKMFHITVISLEDHWFLLKSLLLLLFGIAIWYCCYARFHESATLPFIKLSQQIICWSSIVYLTALSMVSLVTDGTGIPGSPNNQIILRLKA